MSRTIVVKGEGQVVLRPDLIVIRINIESKDADYSKTMEKAAKSIDDIIKEIEKIGFKKEDLKTLNFNISSDYENYTDERNQYKRRFVGYIASQEVKLEFDNNQKLLEEVLVALTVSLTNPDFNISFTIKDVEKATETMLESAAIDAKRKALILTKAARVNLGKLLNIEYNWSKMDFNSTIQIGIGGASSLMSAKATPHIEADDIRQSDTVTFIWEIN